MKKFLKQIETLKSLFSSESQAQQIDFSIGQKVIIRTYSAGVHFGTLVKKCGEEVILENSRRMWLWKAKEGISLSECATLGIDQEKSRIAKAVPQIWMKAIEIIPCSEAAAKLIEEAENAQPR